MSNVVVHAPSVHIIREPIGHRWQDEVVFLDFDSMTNVDAVRVVDDATGAALPSQVVARIEDGSRASRQVCVRVTLQPDQILTLRVEKADSIRADAPFRIDASATEWTIANGHIAVRIPASASFDPGFAPGPIIAVKRAEDSKWAGDGRWGPCPFAGRIETVMLDRGPLFARWITRYIVGGREMAAFDCRLVAGEDFVEVHERTRSDAPAGSAFALRLVGQDAPQCWCSYGGGEQVQTVVKSIVEPAPKFGSRREGELLHLDFHSGHQQMSLTWAGVFRDSNSPLIGVCQFHASRWKIPGRNRIFAMREEGGVSWRFESRGGERCYAIVVGEADRYAPKTGLSRFCEIRRRYSDLPLDKVRRWTTDLHLPSKRSRPLTYPPGVLESIPRKLSEWPALAAKYQQLVENVLAGRRPAALALPTYIATEDPRIREAIFRSIDSALDVALQHLLENGYLRFIIFDGRALKVALDAIDVLRARGEIEASQERAWARKISFIAHAFADDDFWPHHTFYRDRDDPRGQGEAMWDEIGDIICPPNFTAEYFTSFGLAALVYPEHPQSRVWIDKAVDCFRRTIETQFFEGGAYSESVNYTDHELAMLLQLAIALAAAGQHDFFADARFKASFGFMIEMLTPPARLTDAGKELATAPTMLAPDHTQLLTNWGNSGHDSSGHIPPETLAIVAGIYADRDPAYAQRLMSAWRKSPQKFAGETQAFGFLALARPDLPDVELNLQSRIVEGLGAVMRARQGQNDEILAWIRAGIATHHNCRDEGGIVLYAHGAPIIGDLGYHAQHEGRQFSTAWTWQHACVSFDGRTMSMFENVEHSLPPAGWRSSDTADLLVVYRPVNRVLHEDANWFEPQPCPTIHYWRFILFVKPPAGYFVIYDYIPDSTLPITYWMHALADEVEVSDRVAHFRGRYGVDLHVDVLLPQSPQISTGVFSVQRHIRIDQPARSGDYLTVLSALPAGQHPPRASYAGQTREVIVEGAWGTDRIRIDASGLGAATGEIDIDRRVTIVRNNRPVAFRR